MNSLFFYFEMFTITPYVWVDSNSIDSLTLFLAFTFTAGPLHLPLLFILPSFYRLSCLTFICTLKHLFSSSFSFNYFPSLLILIVFHLNPFKSSASDSRKKKEVDLSRVPDIERLADHSLISYLKIIASINKNKEILKWVHKFVR